jgi:DNA-binding NarL/FixJ family response regulator
MGDIRSMLHHDEESRSIFHWRIVNRSGDHVTVEATGYTFTVSNRRMAAFVIQDVRTRESSELLQSRDKQKEEATEEDDVTTLVVCDGVVMKSGLQLILSEKSEKFMYFEYSDEVLSAISSFSCDTVLYACTTCDQTAVREANEILKHSGRKPVMIAALSASTRWLNEAIKAGVRGIIVNETDLKLIPRASKAIASGAMWFSKDVLSQSIDISSHIGDDGKITDRASILTRREREVLSLLAQGKKNKKIAEKLGLSYRTVVTHVYNIYRKLKISSRTEAIHFAIANNLVDVKRS